MVHAKTVEITPGSKVMESIVDQIHVLLIQFC